jgi:hypothetical protein
LFIIHHMNKKIIIGMKVNVTRLKDWNIKKCQECQEWKNEIKENVSINGLMKELINGLMKELIKGLMNVLMHLKKMSQWMNEWLTSSSHVEDWNFSKVWSSLESCQNRFAVIYNDLQSASGTNVHFLSDLACNVKLWDYQYWNIFGNTQ